jgi:hypothetical protein
MSSARPDAVLARVRWVPLLLLAATFAPAPAPALAANTGFRLLMEFHEGHNFVSFPYFYYPSGDLSEPEQWGQDVCESFPELSNCDVRLVTWFTVSGPFTHPCGAFRQTVLRPGRGYVLTVERDCTALIVGSHDDRYSFGRGLETLRLETDRINLVALPYHTVQRTAQELCAFVNTNFGSGGDLRALTRFTPHGPLSVPCGHPFMNFDLVPGEALFFYVASPLDIQFETY